MGSAMTAAMHADARAAAGGFGGAVAAARPARACPSAVVLERGERWQPGERSGTRSRTVPSRRRCTSSSTRWYRGDPCPGGGVTAWAQPLAVAAAPLTTAGPAIAGTTAARPSVTAADLVPAAADHPPAPARCGDRQ